MNKIKIAGASAGVALVSGMVLQVSSAAFTGTTENAGNSWTAGTVTLTDDDAGAAMFASTAQAPGDTETQCLMVTYGGNVTPQTIKLTAAVSPDPAATAVSDTLAEDLDVTVEVGAAGDTCDELLGLATDSVTGALLPAVTGASVYTGTLAAMDTTIVNSAWAPDAEGAGTDMARAFKFTVKLGDDTDNNAQGDTAGATFTWTASS